jgi:hypothetical protein
MIGTEISAAAAGNIYWLCSFESITSDLLYDIYSFFFPCRKGKSPKLQLVAIYRSEY